MMKVLTLPSLAAAGLLASALTIAQTPAQSPAPSDPSAASSPHQRAVTKKPGEEASPGGGTNPSDASSPHQKKAVKKPAKSKPATPPAS